jgi:hypothetical protein
MHIQRGEIDMWWIVLASIVLLSFLALIIGFFQDLQDICDYWDYRD